MGKNFPKISHDSYQNYNMAKIRKHSVLYQDNLKFVLYCIVLYCIVLGVALTRPLCSAGVIVRSVLNFVIISRNQFVWKVL